MNTNFAPYLPKMPKLAVLDLGIELDFRFAEGTAGIWPEKFTRDMTVAEYDKVWSVQSRFEVDQRIIQSRIHSKMVVLAEAVVAVCPSLRRGAWWTECPDFHECMHERYTWDVVRGDAAGGGTGLSEEDMAVVLSPNVARLPVDFTTLR
jgi:hypothetical protein